MHPSTTAQQNIATASAGLSQPAAAMITRIEQVIVWVGSPSSLALHTLVFIGFFAASLLRFVGWDLMLLILTTVVSLEAIYLAIFIQMSVNRQAASLKEVEEDVETIQENVEELGEHVEDIKEDIGEISEDVEDIQEDIGEISEDVEDIQEDIGEISEDSEEEVRKRKQAETLETLTNDVKAMLKHLEALKAR